jgi:hypothetical protein
MEPNRKSDRILSEWNAVSVNARRPSKAPRPRRTPSFWSALGMAGAGLLAAGLVVAVAAFGGRTTNGVAATSPSPVSSDVAVAASPSPGASESPSSIPSPSHSPAAPASPSAPAGPTARPTPAPTPACGAGDLAGRIKSWDGAAGSRIATVALDVAGSTSCTLQNVVPQRLVDGTGRVLASSGSVQGASSMTVRPGQALSTLVEVSNVCGAPPVPAVTIELEVQSGQWLRLKPLSPTDATVPPCNGPSQKAAIQMQPIVKA